MLFVISSLSNERMYICMTEKLPKTMGKTAHRKDLCFILNPRKWGNLIKNLLKKLCPLKKVGLKCPALAIQTAGISYKQGVL